LALWPGWRMINIACFFPGLSRCRFKVKPSRSRETGKSVKGIQGKRSTEMAEHGRGDPRFVVAGDDRFHAVWG
jgi:hypothetical protein